MGNGFDRQHHGKKWPRILGDDEIWLEKHLVDDVEILQIMLQNHVQLVNSGTGKMEPLARVDRIRILLFVKIIIHGILRWFASSFYCAYDFLK